MRRFLTALLREPLLHFLLLGAVVFAAYASLNPRTGQGHEAIVVSAAQIEHLALGFSRTWQRPPSDQELQGLIQDYVKEEVYYREALAMGLDRDDVVVRRRLRQKLEFVSEDVSALAEPTRDDLEAFLREQPARFRSQPRYSFHHVYLDPRRRGDDLAARARSLLARLQQTGREADVAALGDRLLLESEFVGVSAQDIAAQFGEGFAKAVSTVEPNQWSGPFESAYGMHLVFVSERAQGRVPELDEVREVVRREWMNAQRDKATEAFYQKLLARYSISIEAPDQKAKVGLAQR